MSLSAASLSAPSHSLGRPIPYLPGGSWSYCRRLVWPLWSPTWSASHPKQGLSLPAVDGEDTTSAGSVTGQTPRPGLWAAAQTVPEDGSGMWAPPSSLSWSGASAPVGGGREDRGIRWVPCPWGRVCAHVCVCACASTTTRASAHLRRGRVWPCEDECVTLLFSQILPAQPRTESDLEVPAGTAGPWPQLPP